MSSTLEVNISDAFRTKDGFVRSVSIIFQTEYGYLFIDEMRKGYPDPSVTIEESHFLGGKCEMNDPSPIWTGLREVLEELEYHLKSTNSINNSVRILLDEFENCKTFKIDTCVSLSRKLYNRFYVINLETMNNNELKDELMELFLNWRPKNTSFKKGVTRVYFWKKDDPKPSKCTSLLKFFLDNLPPDSK